MTHYRKFYFIGFLLFIALFLVACGGKSEQAQAPTETIDAVTPSAEPPEAEVASQIDKTDPLHRLLSYYPAQLADIHSPSPFSPAFIYLNFETMRSDLGISADISGIDARSDKLDLILGFQLQALPWMPTKRLDPLSGGAFDAWGWDIADVKQALYVDELQTTILIGTFERDEIEEKLLGRDYSKKSWAGFDIFTSDSDSLQIARRDDVLILSTTEDSQFIIGLISQVKTDSRYLKGMNSHPSIKPLIPYLSDAWGAVMATRPLRPEPDNFSLDGLPDHLAALFENMIDNYENTEILWEFVAISYLPTDDTTDIFVYHVFPQAEDAETYIPTIEKFLTETNSHASIGQTWDAFMDVQSVTAEQNITIAKATTQSKNLLGTTVNNHDYYAFIPAR